MILLWMVSRFIPNKRLRVVGFSLFQGSSRYGAALLLLLFSLTAVAQQKRLSDYVKELQPRCPERPVIVGVFPVSPRSCGRVNAQFTAIRNAAVAQARDACIFYLLPLSWQEMGKEAIMRKLTGTPALPCEDFHFVSFTREQIDLYFEGGVLWKYAPGAQTLIPLRTDRQIPTFAPQVVEIRKLGADYNGALTHLLHVDSQQAIFWDSLYSRRVMIDANTGTLERAVSLQNYYCSLHNDMVSDATCQQENACEKIEQSLPFAGIPVCSWQKVEYDPHDREFLIDGSCMVCDTVTPNSPDKEDDLNIEVASRDVTFGITAPSMQYAGRRQVFYGPKPLDLRDHLPDCIAPTLLEPIASAYDSTDCWTFVYRQPIDEEKSRVLIARQCPGQSGSLSLGILSLPGRRITGMIRGRHIYLWTGTQLYVLNRPRK